MLLKLLLIIGAILMVHSKEIGNSVLKKTFHREYFDQLSLEDLDEKDPNGGAVVLKSNLPVAIQNKLAIALTQIYQSTQDELIRAEKFQILLRQYYSVYWNVVINFSAITFYNQYYILLQTNSDRVLAFGLN